MHIITWKKERGYDSHWVCTLKKDENLKAKDEEKIKAKLQSSRVTCSSLVMMI